VDPNNARADTNPHIVDGAHHLGHWPVPAEGAAGCRRRKRQEQDDEDDPEPHRGNDVRILRERAPSEEYEKMVLRQALWPLDG
jgi:hypothetical protein